MFRSFDRNKDVDRYESNNLPKTSWNVASLARRLYFVVVFETWPVLGTSGCVCNLKKNWINPFPTGLSCNLYPQVSSDRKYNNNLSTCTMIVWNVEHNNFMHVYLLFTNEAETSPRAELDIKGLLSDNSGISIHNILNCSEEITL